MRYMTLTIAVMFYLFVCRNDADRQKWMSFFHLYKQQNRATDCIESMSVSEKLELLTGSIHRPLSNKRDSKSLTPSSDSFIFIAAVLVDHI
jgi:hypothetical protein